MLSPVWTENNLTFLLPSPPRGAEDDPHRGAEHRATANTTRAHHLPHTTCSASSLTSSPRPLAELVAGSLMGHDTESSLPPSSSSQGRPCQLQPPPAPFPQHTRAETLVAAAPTPSPAPGALEPSYRGTVAEQSRAEQPLLQKLGKIINDPRHNKDLYRYSLASQPGLTFSLAGSSLHLRDCFNRAHEITLVFIC